MVNRRDRQRAPGRGSAGKSAPLGRTGHVRTADAQGAAPGAELQQPEPPPRPAVNAAAAAAVARFGANVSFAPAFAPVKRPPDAGWLQWIAENLLRGCTPASMLDTMAASGLDRALCAEALQQMESNPAFIAARRWQQIQRKYESVMANQQRAWELAPTYAQVEKRAGVSADEFMVRYVAGSRPLVLTDIARDWPALARWSPQDLKSRFGHLQVEVQAERNVDPKFEQNKLNHRKSIRLADFVDQVVSGGPTNDYYLTANNEMLRGPDFAPLLADIGTLPTYCNPTDLPRLSWFWFGPAGTNTPLHHDTVYLLHTQVVGRKRWRFISPLETPRLYNYVDVFSPINLDAPDLHRYPAFRDVKVLEVVVEPGETVFLPLGWWHQVTALDVSMSFSFTNLKLPNQYTYANPSLPEW